MREKFIDAGIDIDWCNNWMSISLKQVTKVMMSVFAYINIWYRENTEKVLWNYSQNKNQGTWILLKIRYAVPD